MALPFTEVPAGKGFHSPLNPWTTDTSSLTSRNYLALRAFAK